MATRLGSSWVTKMTDDYENAKPVRRGRGPGKRPALINTSLRLPIEVIEYFQEEYP